MHIPKRTSALIVPILALAGCANVTGGRAGLPDRWRTIVSANGATSPTETGPDNARVAADLGLPERRESASGRISGRVVDDRGRPVPSADVRLAIGNSRSGRDIRDVTDPAGGFTLKGLRPGESYTLIAERDNGQEVLVGRAQAEAPETAVRIELLDPETAQAQTQPPTSASRPRVDRVSSRDLARPYDEDEAADPFLGDALQAESPPRAPRTERAPRVNSDDLPPAQEAETLDIPEPRTAMRETKPIWRRVTATSDPDVAATTTDLPRSRPADTTPADPVPNINPPSDPPPATPVVETEAKPEAQPEPESEDEIDPLPPARERPIEPSPEPQREPEPEPDQSSTPLPLPTPSAEPTSTPEPAPETVPPLMPPSSEPEPQVPPLTPPSSAPEPDTEPEPVPVPATNPPTVDPQPQAPPSEEPPSLPRSLEPPPAEAVPALPAEETETLMPPSSPPPEQPDPAAMGSTESVAISAPTAPRRKPTWGELTRAATPPTSAEPIASNLPISTRRLPVKPAEAQTTRGSRFFGLIGARAQNASVDAAPAVMTSTCRYDSKTQRVLDFRLPDLDGNPVSLADLDADFILLDFWGTWCQPCKESIPKLVELQTVYGARTLRVVGIASEEAGTSPQSQVARVDEVARTMGINYPLLMSSLDGKPCPLQQALHIQAYPTMVLLDRTGKILWRGTGAETSTLLKLDRVIAARADSGVVRR